MLSILEAINKGELNATVDIVISNKPDAKGLERAAEFGIPTACFEPSKFESRKAHDLAILEFLRPRNVDYIILAGYLIILGEEFIQEFETSIINIHPSLLPSFKGLNPHKQALEYGVKVAGCTTHFVTEGLDDGPIIRQSAVPVLENDTEATLAARVLEQEHIIFPQSIKDVLEGQVVFQRRARHEKSVN